MEGVLYLRAPSKTLRLHLCSVKFFCLRVAAPGVCLPPLARG